MTGPLLQQPLFLTSTKLCNILAAEDSGVISCFADLQQNDPLAAKHVGSIVARL